VALVGLALLILLVVLGVQLVPTLVDHFGYRTFYSQMEPSGDRYLLETKIRTWIPGASIRCVVIDAKGERQTYVVESISEGRAELQQKIAASTRPSTGFPP